MIIMMCSALLMYMALLYYVMAVLHLAGVMHMLPKVVSGGCTPLAGVRWTLG
jgi:hypothetical protein